MVAPRLLAVVVRRLFVSIVLLGLLLPPAAPAAAAMGGQVNAAAEIGDVTGLPRQEGEPAAQDPAEEPAPVLPDFPVPGPGMQPSPTPATPPDVGTPEPLPPGRAPAPVRLRVRSPQAVVLPGTPFTVMVSVAGTSAEEALPEGLAVSVRLPEGVAPASADSALEWTLPPLASGEELSQTLLLVADGSRPLLGVEATVAGETALPVTQAAAEPEQTPRRSPRMQQRKWAGAAQS